MSQRVIRRTLRSHALPPALAVVVLLLGSPARAQFPDVLSESECAGCAEQVAAARRDAPPAERAAYAQVQQFAGTWSTALTAADDPAWALEDFSCLVACTPAERAAATARLKDPANAHRPAVELFPPAVRHLRFACDPQSFASQAVSPLPLRIEPQPGGFVLRYEQLNAERTVLFHGHHLASANQPGRFGMSKGRLEDGALMVETSHIPAGPSYDRFARGPHSNRLRTTERYTTSGDGNWLFLELTLDDPETLGEPLILTKTWRRVPNARIARYGCDLMSGQLEGVVAEYFDPAILEARR